MNTRVQFVSFNQFAWEAGWATDWTTIDPYVFAYHQVMQFKSQPNLRQSQELRMRVDTGHGVWIG
ncbi:MAG TPA: hypothetical protein PK890_00585 [Terrimesophilobacter sp.]|nr:hypothetical protein [Terrimesophilobacter sp.]